MKIVYVFFRLLIELVCVAILTNAAEPAIFDGTLWHSIATHDEQSKENPLLPIGDSWVNAKTEIFVAVSQFKDSKRCAETLKEIFSKAANPGVLYLFFFAPIFVS
jgi:hypothetical protein